MTSLIIAAVALAAASGLFGSQRVFVVLITLSSACALVSAAAPLLGAAPVELSAAWPVPGGRLGVRVDALSAMFVAQIAFLAAPAAWYGVDYWPHGGRKLRAFYGLVTAGMLLQVVASNGLLFLAGWEVMALAAFMLITTEDEKPFARQTGLLYLVATRLGTLCLFAMFSLCFAVSGTLDLAGWPAALASPFGGTIFVLGLVGFGIKAGIVPLHVWLPDAHATTPSHVSALMSGVLIKMGIYGLARLTSLAAAPPLWWGHTLLALGVVSGVLGVAFALGQHDLKRLLAYHSIENIGIILIGLGLAVLGRAAGQPELAALGLAGALLHTWNHGLFKALLFLSGGAVVHAAGTREIDHLGGLLRRMPRSGAAFLLGAVAICGLPPLNGLVSEILVYLGLFRGGERGSGLWLGSMLAAPALALIGALALACFAKAFGAVFLGHPRTPAAAQAHEATPLMLAPMVLLGAGCLAIGLGAPLVAPILDRAVASWGLAAPRLASLAPLAWISGTSAGLVVALAVGGAWLAARARTAARVVTWDCGYAAPSERMQYTSSSFARALVAILSWALRPVTHAPRVDKLFPGPARFHSHVPEAVLDRAARPIFRAAGRVLERLRPLQRGSVHLYILYIVGTLVALLLWR